MQKILSGEDDGEVRSRAKKAGFDERISLIGTASGRDPGGDPGKCGAGGHAAQLLLTLKNLKIRLGEVAQVG